jgi:RNA 2',3'-cyclic 3'-phosphodiesterase
MRLFIALPLPKAIEESLGELIFVLKQKGRDVKWVAPKNIHMTAKFLGEVGEDKVEKIKQTVTSIAGRHSAVKSNINQLGAFPNLSRPRVIWIGLQEGIEKLAAIVGDVESEMEQLGFSREEKKFSPHITLGRIREGSQIEELINLLKSYQLTPMELVFDNLVLFQSTLTPQGPIYTRLCSARLGEK